MYLEEQNLFSEDHSTLVDSYSPSPEVRKQIRKLLADDAQQKKRTWTYYENMRKENPAEYRTGKIQSQMVKDASVLGEAFQDGNFNDD